MMATPVDGNRASFIPTVRLAASATPLQPPLLPLSTAPLTVSTKFSFDFTTAMMAPPQISTSPSSLNDGNGLHMASAASLTLQSAAAPRPNGSLCSPPPPLLLAPVAIAPLGQQLAVRSPPLAESVAVSPAAKIQPLVPTLTAPSVQIFALGQLIDGTTSITMKMGANQRIISQAPSISQTGGVGIKGVVPNMMLETLPLICEQSPSPPSSPTSPGGGRLSLKKPSPLSVDALQRFDLLSPNYVPSMHYTRLAPPISPGYPTSDLGSSPRSPISVAPHSANWQMFRELRHKRYSSDYVDGDSDIYGKAEYLMTSSQLLSPAPFSPLSDYGASNTGTPYSSRSPNLSPLPTHALNANSALHFSFDQVRSRSSMSNRNGTCSNTPFDNKSPRRRHQYHNRNRHSPMHPRSLDSDDRERSRSEGEMLKKARGYNEDDEEEDGEYVDGMDTSINHSTFSVPSRTSCFGSSSYKKRLLQKHRKSSLQATINIPDTVAAAAQPNAAVGPSSILGRAGELDEKEQQNELLRRQPTIKEPPPSPTFAELFHSRNLDKDRQTQVAEWIRQQASALETFRNLLVPLRQEANLLQVPKNTHVPQPSMEQLSQIFVPSGSQDSSPGPMRLATLWRRSRSESDVSVPINDAAYICEHCGQGFAMHDRLVKHIASRHRDRNTSMNDEKNKIHKCKMCPKSFGRSDMLTRHMRLHTGIKPYSCQICGQVFSRSDHLSTHQRTHTGEKPYRCPHCFYAASRRDMITRHMRIHLRPDGTPLGLNELQIPIGKLSLNQPPTPEPAHATVFEARSVSPAVFRHRPPSSVSPDGMPLGLNELQMPISKLSLPNVNNLSSKSASSLCSAIASTDAYTADNEKIDVKASSSAEKMELGKLESPATTSGHLAALQSSQDSATIHENSKDSVDLLVDSQSYKASNCSERAQDEPQSSVRTPALSSVHRILLDPPSQIFRENRQSKLGPIVMSSLPIAHDGLAPSFASALEGATVHNTLPTATGDIGALSAALLLPQQMLSTNLATADPQLNAAAADSVAAKVLSVALAATSANSAIGLMNSTEINKNCSMPANDGVFLPATGLNSASPSKIFTADKHHSTFQSPSYISGQNVPNHNVENSTSSQIDLLKLMTQLLGANPQLLTDSLQPPAGPADGGGLSTLLRQNSIGGIGFADAAQHSTQS